MRRPEEGEADGLFVDGHLEEGTIHAWLDSALDAGAAAGAARHVASCAQCAAAVAEARGLIAGASRIVGNLDAVAGSARPAIARPVIAPAISRDGQRAPVRHPRRRFPRAERALAGLAAAAVIGAVGLTVLREAPRERGVALEADMVLAIPSDSTVRALAGVQATTAPAQGNAQGDARGLAGSTAEREGRLAGTTGRPEAGTATAPFSAQGAQAAPATRATPAATGPTAPVAADADASRTAKPGAGSSTVSPPPASERAEVRAAREPVREAMQRAVVQLDMQAQAEDARRLRSPSEKGASGAVAASKAAATAAPEPAAASAPERCFAVNVPPGSELRVRLGADPADGVRVAEIVDPATPGVARGTWSEAAEGRLLVRWTSGAGDREMTLDPAKGRATLLDPASRAGTVSQLSCAP